MDPLSFAPILKRARWGGRQLGTVLAKPLGPEADFAESWEICDRGAAQSVVSLGPYEGWTLEKLIHERASELLGDASGLSRFPLLIKFLDVHDRTSVQVHPDDRLAQGLAPGETGKSEAWVILEASPGAMLFAGLLPEIDRPQLEAAIREGTVSACLHQTPALPGDCFYIPAGTVHALGEGLLLAEIQQSSELTYRLFDWNRTGSDGRARELHIPEALNCIDYARGPVAPLSPTRCRRSGNWLRELLVESAAFTLRRHTVHGAFEFSPTNHCRIVSVIQGTLHWRTATASGEARRGDTLLLPASCPTWSLDCGTGAVLLETFWC